jgi:hypothetical protein
MTEAKPDKKLADQLAGLVITFASQHARAAGGALGP